MMLALIGMDASFLLASFSFFVMKPWFSNVSSKVVTTVSNTT